MFYSRSALSRAGLLREGSHGLSHSFPGVFRERKIPEADEQNNAKLSTTKNPLQLRSALAAWSATLATFSIVGFSRTLPELLHVLINGGVEESVCSTSYLTTNKVSKNQEKG